MGTATERTRKIAMETQESWGDEWSDYDEYEYEDEEQDTWDEEDDDYTLPCPACGAEVYEDAEQCPACGEYILESDQHSGYAWRNRPLWWILLGAAGIIAVISTLVLW